MPIETKSALSYARNPGIHTWLTENKYAQIVRTIWFTDLYISTVFSCSLSSTPIAGEDEMNLRAGLRVPGMNQENDLFLYDLFKNHESFTSNSSYSCVSLITLKIGNLHD